MQRSPEMPIANAEFLFCLLFLLSRVVWGDCTVVPHHQHLLLLSPLDGKVAAEFPEGEAVGDVVDDDAVDDRGGEAREAMCPS